MSNALTDKVAVVTGASRGIGWATAVALAAQGAHIIALGRTTGALEELDDTIKAAGGSTTLVPMDMKDYPAIDNLGKAIYERWGKLDIVIGNAGQLGVLTPLGHLDAKVWDDVMAVNVTANWHLIRSLDPLLKKAKNAQALFLSSGAAQKCLPYWGGYSVSKAALEALVKTYANENVTTNVVAGLINPGPIRTHMRAKAMPGEDPATLAKPEILGQAIAGLIVAGSKNGAVYDFKSGALTLRP